VFYDIRRHKGSCRRSSTQHCNKVALCLAAALVALLAVLCASAAIAAAARATNRYSITDASGPSRAFDGVGGLGKGMQRAFGVHCRMGAELRGAAVEELADAHAAVWHDQCMAIGHACHHAVIDGAEAPVPEPTGPR
jgi:hypothetical protein